MELVFQPNKHQKRYKHKISVLSLKESQILNHTAITTSKCCRLKTRSLVDHKIPTWHLSKESCHLLPPFNHHHHHHSSLHSVQCCMMKVSRSNIYTNGTKITRYMKKNKEKRGSDAKTEKFLHAWENLLKIKLFVEGI